MAFMVNHNKNLPEILVERCYIIYDYGIMPNLSSNIALSADYNTIPEIERLKEATRSNQSDLLVNIKEYKDDLDIKVLLDSGSLSYVRGR